ncbi:hypothetical protein SOPP22_10000 [Shewanella sp. OPT22]|nr:hypothetical protein SOPP22_10000 [Shewanella sp. OPT22]
MALWLIKNIVGDDSDKLKEIIEELLTEPVLKGGHNEKLSYKKISENFDCFCKKAQGQIEHSPTAEECTVPIKFNNTFKEGVEDFLKVSEMLKELIEAAKTDNENERLTKMLAAYPAKSSTLDSKAEREQGLKSPMITNSDVHPAELARKGILRQTFTSDTSFDNALIQVSGLSNKRLAHWIHRYNSRISRRPPQLALTAGNIASPLALNHSGQLPLAIKIEAENTD